MGIRFGVFEEIKLALTLPDESGAVVSTGLAPPSPFGPVEKFAAGSIAGLTAVLCTYPLDLIKVSQMVAPRGHPLGSFSSAIALHVTAAMHPNRPRAALTRATIRGMFRGLLPTCIGIVLHDGAAFLVFETAKEVWIASELTRATSVAELAFGQHFVFGALAGMAARSISLPFDVVRKRLMAQPLLEAMGKPQPLRFATMAACIRDTVAHEGWRALWRGRVSNRISMVLSSSITFAVYEKAKRVLEAWVYVDDDYDDHASRDG
ncbi:carrier protein [Thecamonas trahens ATCC 50062]|uniref:Carrier protein n=1 Tax=Thecamonas trahens ATCC 50062 TaxID=461836 RepID=A0A0L0D9S6_THETB|nr:carrier protein [Thecamonas trahens ATCC 50062]KNC49102.1 carrier protein [Thecamonas trahens ATCC 50062]|eukprot:XP_013758130.1 carrier protein [Thecamonas trahens ATCC 50062]